MTIADERNGERWKLRSAQPRTARTVHAMHASKRDAFKETGFWLDVACTTTNLTIVAIAAITAAQVQKVWQQVAVEQRSV